VERFWWDPLGRVVTGPLAFLVAGVIDVLAFVIASLWFRTRKRLARI
jgi:hypothetical protein